ncbi:MAG: hypothetical protein J5626_09475, partial [Lachnospiraceae bacterium]|nr:hypothetical protein [Lachnospiraceae bacterium]
KKRISAVVVLGIVILAIAVFCVYRLIDWNARSIDFNTDDIEEGEFDVELLDMYVYPSDEEFPNHIKDDVEDILIIGNVYASNYGKDKSIVNILKEKLDANIIDLSVDKSMVSCDYEGLGGGRNCAALYHLVHEIHDRNYSVIEASSWNELFETEERYENFRKVIETVDFNKIDTVMIMYNLIDYYAGKAAIAITETDIRGLRGSYEQALTFLREEYPHLNIIIVSPYPSVFTDSDGKLVYSSTTDYGLLNSSYYFENIYLVATKYCTSFIDNYSYNITESNITEYVKETLLTDKGIDYLGNHIVDFLNKKGATNY